LNDLDRPRPHHPYLAPRPDAERALNILLASLNPNTLRAYTQDLDAFAQWFIGGTIGDAAETIFLASQGTVNSLGFDWRSSMLADGLAPATVNRRLAALKALIRTGRVLGLVPYELEVPPVKSKSLRDTRGPTLLEVESILRAAKAQVPPKAERDVAIIRLMYDLALRRGEIASLDREHIEADRIWVLGKGSLEREAMTLPEQTAQAVQVWLQLLGIDGAAFRHIDRHGHIRQRLTGAGLYDIVQQLGRAAGVKTRPHGFRHAAITRASIATGGNVHYVKLYARHANANTTMAYIDQTDDHAGRVAAMVARTLGGE
jgi:integrase/recombinase XerC